MRAAVCPTLRPQNRSQKRKSICMTDYDDRRHVDCRDTSSSADRIEAALRLCSLRSDLAMAVACAAEKPTPTRASADCSGDVDPFGDLNSSCCVLLLVLRPLPLALCCYISRSAPCP